MADKNVCPTRGRAVFMNALTNQCLALLVSEMSKAIDEDRPRRPADATKSLKKLLNRYRRASRQRELVKPSPEELIAVRADIANRIHELEALANPRAAATDHAAPNPGPQDDLLLGQIQLDCGGAETDILFLRANVEWECPR